MTGRRVCRTLCAVAAFLVAGSAIARADILDAEDWSNHTAEIQQINNTQQFRRTMNRSFDMMAGMGGGGDAADGGSAAERIAKQHAAWDATLIVPAAAPGSELHRFLTRIDPRQRNAVRTYLLRAFAAFPAEAAQAGLNPNNVADVRIAALQMAFRAVRPSDPIPPEASFLIQLALTQQMAGIYTQRALTTRQKQDTIDYYVIARTLFRTAVPGSPKYSDRDAASRSKIVAVARSFVQHDGGVDPTTVSWGQLPCVGSSPVDCQVHLGMARAAVHGAR